MQGLKAKLFHKKFISLIYSDSFYMKNRLIFGLNVQYKKVFHFLVSIFES